MHWTFSRPYAILAAFAAAALVTPTIDIISQAVVAVPMYLMYEVGVRYAGRVRSDEL